MSTPNNENLKKRIERLLQIDIYEQATRPREEVDRELKALGIDTGKMAEKAIQLTREALKKTRNVS